MPNLHLPLLLFTSFRAPLMPADPNWTVLPGGGKLGRFRAMAAAGLGLCAGLVGVLLSYRRE